MDVRYRVYIEQSVIDGIQQLHGKARTNVKAFIQSLAGNPFEEGDYSEQDPQGRTVNSKVLGDYSLGFYADHAVKEVKVFEFVPADK